MNKQSQHRFFVFAILASLCTQVAFAANGFVPTGSFPDGGRYGASTALLPDGKVLIAGGFNNVNLATAEIYDPASGTFAATANNLSVARGFATATTLSNGDVLIANGGDYNDGGVATTAADLYDPSTGLFSATDSTHAARHGSTATLLPNGKVLIVGGISSNSQTRLATAELYDPTAGTFTYTGSMVVARDYQIAVLLQNGKVLIAGGGDGSGVALDSSELYDPVTGTFALSGTMLERRDDATGTLLPNGKVLVVGGGNNDVSNGTAELYDPATGTFSASQSSIAPRSFATATVLPNGSVLICGGVDGANSANTLNDAQLYDPASDTFTLTGAMATPRFDHSAVLLKNGTVLVAGGYNGSGVTSGAEIYSGSGDEIFADGFEGP
jgi:WD40 repeat protein